MNKDMYIQSLRKNLSGLCQDELIDVISDIEEYFNEGESAGRTEAEIAKGLGNPVIMASKIKLESVGKNNDIVSNLSYIGRVIGLGFGNLITLPLFFAAAMLLFAMFAVVYSLFLASGIMIISPILKYISPSLVSTGGIPVVIFSIGGIAGVFMTTKLHKMMCGVKVKSTEMFVKYMNINAGLFSK